MLFFHASYASVAVECDISKFKDNISYHSKVETTLAYTDQVASKIASQNNLNVAVNFFRYCHLRLLGRQLDVIILEKDHESRLNSKRRTVAPYL